MKDPIVESVVTKYKERSSVGVHKYGTTLQDNNLTLDEWLNHLQEELMDATLYIEKLRQEQSYDITLQGNVNAIK
jgi:hypothetical protein